MDALDGKNGTATRASTRVNQKSHNGETDTSGEVWFATTSTTAARRKRSNAAPRRPSAIPTPPKLSRQIRSGCRRRPGSSPPASGAPSHRRRRACKTPVRSAHVPGGTSWALSARSPDTPPGTGPPAPSAGHEASPHTDSATAHRRYRSGTPFPGGTAG